MSGANKVVRTVSPKSMFESAKSVISITTTYDQGDHLIWDDTNKVIARPAAETDGATYLGVARSSITLGKQNGPYAGLTDVDAAQAIVDEGGPVYGNINKFVLKTGESLSPGGYVYLDPATGTRGVAASGTKAVGVYQGKTITTSTAGLEIEVLTGARFPNDVLKF
jgi:hypothetical protein